MNAKQMNDLWDLFEKQFIERTKDLVRFKPAEQPLVEQTTEEEYDA